MSIKACNICTGNVAGAVPLAVVQCGGEVSGVEETSWVSVAGGVVSCVP